MKTLRQSIVVFGALLLTGISPFVWAEGEYSDSDFEYSDRRFDHYEKGRKYSAVVTGAYRCPGDFPGFKHSISFTASELGALNIETQFGNLDTGDCTPRGKDAMAVAKELGCTTGSLYAFQRGGGAGGAFDFVCPGNRHHIIRIIQKLSEEILRPTQ